MKYSKVLELPEVLCIHLKRFRHELMFSAKISSYVAFPLEGLDMRPYLHKGNLILSSCKPLSYDLVPLRAAVQRGHMVWCCITVSHRFNEAMILITEGFWTVTIVLKVSLR